MSPYVCPVCKGTGYVPAGFYAYASSICSTAPERCRTCKGEGIVWEPKEDK